MPVITQKTPRIRRVRAPRVLLALQLLATLPAAVGSLVVITTAGTLLGRYALLLPALWLAMALAMLTRSGERLTVRALGFQPLTDEQARLVDEPWRTACQQAGIHPDDVDLYIRPATSINAAITGGRSIAITTAALHGLTANVAPGTGHGPLTVLLLHELGHHNGRATRYSLALNWLAAPWRAITRLLLAIVARLGGFSLPVLILGTLILGVAIVQTSAQNHPELAAFIAFIAIAGIGLPLLDAWATHQQEYHADAYAAEHSSAAAVVDLLEQLPQPTAHRRGIARLLRTHPTHQQRIHQLHHGVQVASRAARQAGNTVKSTVPPATAGSSSAGSHAPAPAPATAGTGPTNASTAELSSTALDTPAIASALFTGGRVNNCPGSGSARRVRWTSIVL